MNITIWFCDEWCPKCVDELVCLKTRNSGIALVIDGEIVKKMWKWKWMKMKMNENVIDEMIDFLLSDKCLWTVSKCYHKRCTNSPAGIDTLGMNDQIFNINVMESIHNMNTVGEWNSR